MASAVTDENDAEVLVVVDARQAHFGDGEAGLIGDALALHACPQDMRMHGSFVLLHRLCAHSCLALTR